MSLVKNALHLAWMDVKARYKKSILGPFWMTFGNLIAVVGLGIVWSSLLGEDPKTFIPAISIGLILWQLLASTIGEGTSAFIRQASIIRNVAMPVWFFTIRAVARQIINFLHNLIIIVGVVWYFDLPVTSTTWLILPGILLVVLNLYWITYIIGVLGARFRDIEFLVNSFLPLLFFVSPVIFRADRLPAGLEIIWLNPLSYFIEIVRAPLLGNVPSINTYLIMIGFLIGGSLLTFWFDQRYAKRLAFWV